MNKDVIKRFHEYPEEIRSKLLNLRNLIRLTASNLDLGKVEESLKMG